MEAWDLLRNIWFVLIGVLLAGYSILDGFDLGVGALLPFLAKNEDEKRTLIGAVGPVWDGNEVWLLAGGGALFAAFPMAYATVFSGFYLAMMLVLFALILRAVSLEFRAHDPARTKIWEAAFVGGSALPALLLGVALGNVVAGVPLDARTEFTGSIFTLLRPLPLVFGLLGLCAFLLHGAVYAGLKSEGDLRRRAERTSLALTVAFGAAFALSFVMIGLDRPEALKIVPAWVFAAVVVFSLVLLALALKKGRDGRAFFFSSTAFLGLWGIVGAIQYPDIVRATDPALSLTIRNASSSALTLKVMLIVALVGMPAVIAYTIFAFRVFKGKAGAEGAGY
ncbi:MAG TPA: cytochrome d ubiquinol oxidase subunit II [Acidobacteriota bacterium]|nr:cytochrome d ubiquinol oxidase subunit II [Acidobacteriota bacterium]